MAVQTSAPDADEGRWLPADYEDHTRAQLAITNGVRSARATCSNKCQCRTVRCCLSRKWGFVRCGGSGPSVGRRSPTILSHSCCPPPGSVLRAAARLLVLEFGGAGAAPAAQHLTALRQHVKVELREACGRGRRAKRGRVKQGRQGWAHIDGQPCSNEPWRPAGGATHKKHAAAPTSPASPKRPRPRRHCGCQPQRPHCSTPKAAASAAPGR